MRSTFVFACVCVLAAAAPGCGGSSRAYAPDAGAARAALEAAPGAWKKGEKPGALASAVPPVNVSDFQWQAGLALADYEVGEGTPAGGDDASVRFAATLTLKNAKGPTKAEYVVVGRDPVWVYRGEDYTRLMNMDDNPRAAPVRRKR
jgi:hypothetical protein